MALDDELPDMVGFDSGWSASRFWPYNHLTSKAVSLLTDLTDTGRDHGRVHGVLSFGVNVSFELHDDIK